MENRDEGTGGEQRPILPAPSTSAPATPSEKPRSRFDQYYESPSQSPMIRITEEDHAEDDTQSVHTDLFPPSSAHTNKRHTFYGIDNNSSSSLMIPGGNVPGNRSSTTSLKYVPQIAPPRNKSPSRNKSPHRDTSPSRYRSPSPKKPFNFKSTNLSAPTSTSTRASHRKGHRYKHSSVSMNLFQEPKQRAPLKIPASYPIPTAREFLSSCTTTQRIKLSWSCFHLLLSSAILLFGLTFSLHSLSTLSHLVFYDSLGCIAVVLANIMSNFDVYTQSSIKFPFGLGRIRVLFEFALSVSLVFVGCDLISHFVEEIIINFFDENSEHHHHASGHNYHNSHMSTSISLLHYEVCIFLTMITTFLSPRISSDSFSLGIAIGNLRSILSNPTHFITFIFAAYLAIHPLLLNLQSDIAFSEFSSLGIAILIIYMGWKIVKNLGYVVLLSSPALMGKSSKISELEQLITSLASFKSSYILKNMIVSEVHMNLIIVLINVRMVGGTDDEEIALRYNINDVINQKLRVQNKVVQTTIDIDRI